jgi:hypothetical protein
MNDLTHCSAINLVEERMENDNEYVVSKRY